MLHSTDRFLTTHVGSLPRPAALLQDDGRPPNPRRPDDHDDAVRTAVDDAVRRQVEVGIDIPSDGEMSKPSFLTYVSERLAGFEQVPGPSGGSPWAGSREALQFPDYYQAHGTPAPAAAAAHLTCTSPISYIGQDAVRTDIATLQASAAASGVSEAFLPAISPSNVEGWYTNQHYATGEEFLFAIADALAVEYRMIVESGLLLQIDDPRLITYPTLTPGLDSEEYRRWAAVRIDALNHALRGLPRDRVRFHSCYSIDMGPRVNDAQLPDVIDLMLSVHAGAYSFEAANPRHEHEWQVWQQASLPDDAVLIPGVVTQSTVLVEHPELVALRLQRFADVVGRERVIAGADCGFGTFAGSTHIPASVAWAKLASIAEGARLATNRVWQG